jgi:hypothetical protein
MRQIVAGSLNVRIDLTFLETRRIVMRKLIAVLGLACSLSGCAVYARPAGCFWVPGHYDRFGFYHRGHWRC